MADGKDRGPGGSGDNGPDGFVERAERVLEGYAARIVLSVLILVSVLPLREVMGLLPHGVELLPEQGVLDVFFFCVFGAELAVRAVAFGRRPGRRPPGEWVLLALDLVAVLSFLPLQHVVDLRHARLIRLSRIVLLFGYWSPMVRDLWSILVSRERRFQILFVLFSGVVLSFAGAVVLHWLATPDFDGDLQQDTFFATLWWSFRQVEDPGNLVESPTDGAVVVVSLLLTFAGLVLFSFLVGIGTAAIDELMQRSRMRPVGLRNHSVILGLGEHSHFLLDEFADLYRKNRRPLRAAVLGPAPTLPPLPAVHAAPYRYRRGDPVRSADLDRVDVARAKRVLVLGTQPVDPDAAVVAAILALRDRSPHVDVYADLEHESNVAAARAAGGARTHVVATGAFVGNYIAQNVANPGIYRLYRQLLTSAGCEVYTYIFDAEERARFVAAAGADGTLDCVELHARAAREFGATLIGYFVAPPADGELEFDDLAVLLAPCGHDGPAYARDGAGRVRADAVRGVIAVALRFETVRAFGQELVARPRAERRVGTADPALGALRLEPTGGHVGRVVVVGDTQRIPRVVTDLIAVYGALRVDVLTSRADVGEALARDLVLAFERTLPGRPVERDVTPTGARFAVELADGGRAEVAFGTVAWSDSTRLARDPAVDLARTDVLLLLPRTRGADASDGHVALECLQLAELEERGEAPYPSHTRVVAMVQDPVKGDLLEHRLVRDGDRARRQRFTVISSERVRHHFLVQNTFVRGLNAVYAELFAPDGPSLRRVLPRTSGGAVPSGAVDPWTLARHLLEERGLILFGVELGAPGEHSPATTLDPRELFSGATLAWQTVRALYVLGTRERVAAAAR